MGMDVSSLVPPPPPGVVNLRGTRFFEKNKLEGTYSSTLLKRPMPAQFEAYNASNASIVCLADLDAVTKYLAKIDRKPVRTTPDEQFRRDHGLTARDYAIVSLVMNNYLDTSVGPYKAIMVSTPARSAHFNPQQEWKGPGSAIVPMLKPDVELVIGPLAMSKNPGALAIGREQMGINKYEADVRLETSNGATAASIGDEQGVPRLVVRVGQVSDAEALESSAQLFPSIGFLRSFEVLLKPSEHPFVGWDDQDKEQLPPRYCHSVTLTQPRFRAWDPERDELTYVETDDLTRKLKAFAVYPILASHDEQISVFVKPDRAASERNWPRYAYL